MFYRNSLLRILRSLFIIVGIISIVAYGFSAREESCVGIERYMTVSIYERLLKECKDRL